MVGLLGVLGRRKGVLTFLRAMRQLDPAKCFFLLAGQLEERERRTYTAEELRELDELLREAAGRDNALVWLGHIETEAEFNALIESCTMVYLAYGSHVHSSGLLGKAAHFRKLVIAPNRGCMAERTSRYAMGLWIRPDSAADTVQAIETLCRPAEQARRLAQAWFEGYLAVHHREKLAEALEQLLGGEA